MDERNDEVHDCRGDYIESSLASYHYDQDEELNAGDEGLIGTIVHRDKACDDHEEAFVVE